jgi:hypothetical protein
MSQEERGGLDALAERRSSSSIENAPVDRAALDRAEAHVDTSSGGGLNIAAVEAAGLNRAESGGANMPGTDDIGAAAGRDVGAGLGGTRGGGPQNPRGQISGVGGTRGSGAGTGHQEDTVR